MFEVGKKYKMRGGGTVRVLTTDRPRDRSIVSMETDDGAIWGHYPNGKVSSVGEAPYDLLPPKREAWVVVFWDETGAYGTVIRNTEAEAQQARDEVEEMWAAVTIHRIEAPDE